MPISFARLRSKARPAREGVGSRRGARDARRAPTPAPAPHGLGWGTVESRGASAAAAAAAVAPSGAPPRLRPPFTPRWHARAPTRCAPAQAQTHGLALARGAEDVAAAGNSKRTARRAPPAWAATALRLLRRGGRRGRAGSDGSGGANGASASCTPASSPASTPASPPASVPGAAPQPRALARCRSGGGAAAAALAAASEVAAAVDALLSCGDCGGGRDACLIVDTGAAPWRVVYINEAAAALLGERPRRARARPERGAPGGARPPAPACSTPRPHPCLLPCSRRRPAGLGDDDASTDGGADAGSDAYEDGWPTSRLPDAPLKLEGQPISDLFDLSAAISEWQPSGWRFVLRGARRVSPREGPRFALEFG
jgi:hypothetical protein